MQSPVKLPSTRNAAPTSGALAPLRARQTISSALPSLSDGYSGSVGESLGALRHYRQIVRRGAAISLASGAVSSI